MDAAERRELLAPRLIHLEDVKQLGAEREVEPVPIPLAERGVERGVCLGPQPVVGAERGKVGVVVHEPVVLPARLDGAVEEPVGPPGLAGQRGSARRTVEVYIVGHAVFRERGGVAVDGFGVTPRLVQRAGFGDAGLVPHGADGHGVCVGVVA